MMNISHQSTFEIDVCLSQDMTLVIVVALVKEFIIKLRLPSHTSILIGKSSLDKVTELLAMNLAQLLGRCMQFRPSYSPKL